MTSSFELNRKLEQTLVSFFENHLIEPVIKHLVTKVLASFL